jgi:hypothetical protein
MNASGWAKCEQASHFHPFHPTGSLLSGCEPCQYTSPPIQAFVTFPLLKDSGLRTQDSVSDAAERLARAVGLSPQDSVLSMGGAHRYPHHFR